MFIKDLTVKNLRCFGGITIEGFNVPDGTTPASGLNIFIGENGSGKTTILEAINFLTQSSYSTSNSMDISDYKDMEQELSVSYKSSQIFKCKMPPTFRGCYYESDGIKFKANPRKTKSPGKLLSSPFSVSSSFNCTTPNYKKANGDDSGNAVIEYYKTYAAENIDGDELNVFYFDKNRTRQLTQGNYKTTFERICDDLNWRFIKTLNDDATKKQAIIDSLTGDYFQQAKDAAQSSAGKKVADDLAEFLDNDKYKNLKLDIINYLGPFSSGLLALRE
ncbi:MAG: AAA family ATPase, partial [Candidatus Saccharimonadales bacterium]